MVTKVLLINICLAALLFGICCGQGCPRTMFETDKLNRWVSDTIGDCFATMMGELRKSRDDCSNKVAIAGTCMTDEAAKCTANITDPNFAVMVQHTVGGIASEVPKYVPIFCGGEVTDWPDITPSLQMEVDERNGCSDELETQNRECAVDFVKMFKSDPFDEELCETFKDVIDCQAERARSLCSTLNEQVLDNNINRQRKMNFYCVGIGGDENAENDLTGREDLV
ncbi:uncharacterized protein LOC144452167 [Glandiceps talaboti]